MFATLSNGFVSDPVRNALSDGARVRERPIDRLAYANDASHYLMTPNAVLIAEGIDEIAAIMRAASDSGEHLTFRSGGSSLSGQASSDGLLVDTRRGFRRVTVLDGGARVKVEPGATIRQVNAQLYRYGRRLGPDPASDAACTIGGMIANNSSGMVCGTTENTYQTLESAVLVLASGTVIDTADPHANQLMREKEPELTEGLLRLQRRVRENDASVAAIRAQFAMKNTLGYGINAFLDASDPAELLLKLVIGSEGTLAFVAEATLRTVERKQHASTTLALFSNLVEATDALPELVDSGAATLELMDATSLRVGQRFKKVPDELLSLGIDQQAALLIEYQASSPEELAEARERGQQVLGQMRLNLPARLSEDAAARDSIWKFRKGLYTSVAEARPNGTTALLEDVVVPVEKLAGTCEQLQVLFERFGYDDSVIFGHAKDGNIHFMLTDRFEGDAALGRYIGFTDEMVDLILGAGGNLKAEHGTGRVMAPYVRRQYGDELYAVMQELKRLCDPLNILNPGVIIDDNPEAHIQHIKVTPAVEQEVDSCVECGFCEPVCPSRDLTLTPRQRIVARRAHADAVAAGDTALVASLERDYQYDGKQTCAVDGMCQTACPLSINTGALVKRLRHEEAHPVPSALWKTAATGWGTVTRVGSVALTAASKLPTPVVAAATKLGRGVLGEDNVPLYSDELPGGGSNRRQHAGVVGQQGVAPQAIYLPACVGSMFGAGSADTPGVTEAFVSVLQRAGVAVLVPENIEGLCCGTPWQSKGFKAGGEIMKQRVIDAVEHMNAGATLPIISDSTSCTEGFTQMLTQHGFVVQDALAFAQEVLMPRLAPQIVTDKLVLHPTCSSMKLDLNDALVQIAETVAADVQIPLEWGCCGYAGDRGMLHPELTDSATKQQATEILDMQADTHASCNRTCEVAMTRATGQPYQNIFELLEQATR